MNDTVFFIYLIIALLILLFYKHNKKKRNELMLQKGEAKSGISFNPLFPECKRELILSIFPEKFIVFDFETTGLNPAVNEIIEIGAIRFYRDYDCLDTFQALVRPKNKIPNRITELTGITQHMVDDKGYALNFVLPEFLEFIGELPLVAFNAAFDISFLDNALTQCQLPIKHNNRVACALEMARRTWPGLESYKLLDLDKLLGITFEETHRALDDCNRALHVFLEAATKLRGIEGFEEDLAIESDSSNKLIFQAENINFEELKNCEVGDPVDLWTPNSGMQKIYIYRDGTSWGAGRIGNVPFKYSSIFLSHFREELPYQTKILDLKTGKIECRLISKQETEAEQASLIKIAGECISAVLSKKYKRTPKDNFIIWIELPINHKQEIGNILFLEPKPIEFYIQNPEPLCINFLDKQGNKIARMINEKDKILRMLRAYYSNYKVSIKIIEFEEEELDNNSLPYFYDIDAKAIVSYEIKI